MTDDSIPQIDSLEALTRGRFGKLSQAEARLTIAARRGETAYCGPDWHDEHPENDPSKSDGWGSEREIRGELMQPSASHCFFGDVL